MYNIFMPIRVLGDTHVDMDVSQLMRAHIKIASLVSQELLLHRVFSAPLTWFCSPYLHTSKTPKPKAAEGTLNWIAHNVNKVFHLLFCGLLIQHLHHVIY